MYFMVASVVLFSLDSRPPTHCRHVTIISSPQLLFYPQLTNRDVRDPFRPRHLRAVFARKICFYKTCRMGAPLFPLWNSTLCDHKHSPLLLTTPYLLSFQVLAHSFALAQTSTLLFSIDSALFAKNHPGLGYLSNDLA